MRDYFMAKLSQNVVVLLFVMVTIFAGGHISAAVKGVSSPGDSYKPPLTDSVTVALTAMYDSAYRAVDYVAMRNVAIQLIPYFQHIERPMLAADFAQHFLRDMEQSGSDSLITRAYYNVGVMFFRVGLFSVSRDYFIRMNSFELDRQIQCRLYYALAETSRQMSVSDIDIDDYYRKSGEIARELNDSSAISSSFFGQSQVLFESLDLSRYPFVLSQGLIDTVRRANALLNEAVSFNPASFQAYLGIALNHAVVGEFSDAYSYMSAAREIADASEPEQTAPDGTRQLTPIVHNSYAFIYLLDGRPDDAILYARQTYDYSKMFDKKGDMLNAMKILYEACKLNNDFKAAADMHEEILRLQTAITKSEREQEVIAMQINFDADFKEERLQSQIALNHVYYSWGIISTILLGLCIVFLFLYVNFYRKKQHAYKKLYQRSLEWASTPTVVRAKNSRCLTPEDEKLSELYSIMESEKFYSDPSLTISTLAQKINMGRTSLSQLINSASGSNFNDFINGFRIKEAIRLIEMIKDENISITSIIYNAGFSDRSTFYRAFKKVTGMSPIEYINARKKGK